MGIPMVNVGGYDGIIVCPDYSRICGNTEWCNDLFDWSIKNLPI